MSADLELALELANIADSASMARFRSPHLRIDRKADHSPVTEVDIGVETALRSHLELHSTGDAVTGEEFGASGTPGSPRRWLLDPIDGTKSYARGNENWATLISLAVDGITTVAVASAPALGQRYWAVRSGGSCLNGEPIHVSTVTEITSATLAHTSLSGFMHCGYGDALTALASRCWDARGLGNSLSHLWVARGSADIGWTARAQCWDFGALSLIVEEAGGRFHNGATSVTSGPGISSNGLLHEAAMSATGIRLTESR